jgi:hypothetical protein
MNGREDLDKLFEAALHGTQAPSRFGTPDSMKKAAPAAFGRPAPPFQAAPSPASASPATPSAPFQAAPSAPFQAAPSAVSPPAPAGPEVVLDKHGMKSLDSAVNAELAEIMDQKIAREKARKRRGRLVLVLSLLGISGGAAGWVASNPERVQAMKQTIAEIKSAGDIKGMVAKYQAALDKVAVRGKQIDAATTAMGVDPASVDEHEDPGFDKEMRAMMGEEGGKTTAARDKILRDKFGDVQKTGSLIKKKEDAPVKDGE